MRDSHTWVDEVAVDEDAPIVLGRRTVEEADMDITPMIDMTFLLIIFFLVSSIPDVQTAVELPPARYGVGVGSRTAIILTVADRGGPGPARVYIDDGKHPESLLPDDPEAQAEQIRQYVEREMAGGKNQVLIKAERSVRHRDVSRVSAAVGEASGELLYLAVFETD